jgi:hypothetical protein
MLGERCTGVLTVTPESNPLSEPLQFAVDHEGCRLLSPTFPALQPLLHTAHAPALLLRLLSHAGVHVVPEERDAEFVGMDMKEHAVEQQACADAASVCARYFLTSSKWNQQLSTADCVLRLAQLQHNFDRTETRDALKIFDREKEQEVVTVIRQRKGCALLPLAESAAVMPPALKVLPHTPRSYLPT